MQQPPNYPHYRSWRDQGDNVGVQCSQCGRTHWNEDAPATDPLTGEACDNCQVIKTSGVLAAENKRHKEVCDPTNPHPENLCHHEPSQPNQKA